MNNKQTFSISVLCWKKPWTTSMCMMAAPCLQLFYIYNFLTWFPAHLFLFPVLWFHNLNCRLWCYLLCQGAFIRWAWCRGVYWHVAEEHDSLHHHTGENLIRNIWLNDQGGEWAFEWYQTHNSLTDKKMTYRNSVFSQNLKCFLMSRWAQLIDFSCAPSVIWCTVGMGAPSIWRSARARNSLCYYCLHFAARL